MSCIIDFAETSSYTTNVLNGFDIVGLENSENMLQNTTEEEAISNGNFTDLMENAADFDFINDEVEDRGTLDLESDGTATDNSLVEDSQGGELMGETVTEDGFTLEFFKDGVNIIGNFGEQESSVFVGGIGNDAEIEYDELSGTFSVDGQEIAKIDAISNLNNNNYEMF